MEFTRPTNSMVSNDRILRFNGGPVLRSNELEEKFKIARRRKPYPRFSSLEQALLHRIQRKQLLTKVEIVYTMIQMF